MKINDVKIGDEYICDVSGRKVRVRAMRIVEREVLSWPLSGRYRRRVVVARVDTGHELPKARGAASLHAVA